MRNNQLEDEIAPNSYRYSPRRVSSDVRPSPSSPRSRWQSRRRSIEDGKPGNYNQVKSGSLDCPNQKKFTRRGCDRKQIKRSQSHAHESPVKLDNSLARACEVKLNFKRRLSNFDYDTKSTSSSESGGCQNVSRSGQRNDLIVRRLSMDGIQSSHPPRIYPGGLNYLHDQLGCLDFVVPSKYAEKSEDSKGNLTDRSIPRTQGPKLTSKQSDFSKLLPHKSLPPKRDFNRSRSVNVSSSEQNNISASFQTKMRSGRQRHMFSRTQETEAPFKTRNSTGSTPLPSASLLRNSDTLDIRRDSEVSIRNSCLCRAGTDPNRNESNPANDNAMVMKPPSPPPKILPVHTNVNSSANKKLIKKILSSNQVTDMPYTDPKGDSGLYTGEIDPESRIPHGKGKMKYENGIFYEGKWVNGSQDSKAAIQWERILSGFTSWKGKSKSGDKRNSDGVRNIYGMEWVDLNGMSGRYTGTINKDEVPHGHGRLYYDYGLIVEGTWVRGVLNDGARMAAASSYRNMTGRDATIVPHGSGNGSISVVSGVGKMSIRGSGGMGRYHHSLFGGCHASIMYQDVHPSQYQSQFAHQDTLHGCDSEKK